MVAELKIDNPTSGGGVEQLFEGDFKQLRRELDEKLWPSWIREGASAQSEEESNPPGLVITTTVSQPNWVSVEVEGGYLRVDRSKFSVEQEAYYQASQHMSREDWPNAAEAFRKVLELNPDPLLRQGVTIMAGIAYHHAGDLDQAARMFEEAIRLNERSDFAHLFLGTAHMLAGRYEEAITPLRRSLELNPYNSHVHFYLGYVYEELDQTENAIASYNAEIENHREATEAYEHLAKLYKRLGDENLDQKAEYYLRAIETYKKWAQVDPSNSAVRNLVGYLYTQVGNIAGATEAFAKAVEAKPDNLIALSNWGVAYLNAERSREAKEIFERMVSLGEGKVREQLAQTASDDLDEEVRRAMAETYQLLGAANLMLHQEQGRAGGVQAADRSLLLEAESAFKTALSYNPVDIHSLYNLGLVNWGLKRRVAAAKFFSRTLELDPDHQDAAKGLRTVQDESEQWRRWMGDSVGTFASSASDENPVSTEDLVEKLAECRAKLYEGVDPAHEDEAFTPEDLLNAMLPVAEWLSKNGSDDLRFVFAALIFERGWLSSGKAARLAGLDRVTFLTNLHRVGIAVLDLDEEELENQASYVNAQ
jgi:tetratricopeptide (TPR) repeat protein/predicted HTH domain antitoxin